MATHYDLINETYFGGQLGSSYASDGYVWNRQQINSNMYVGAYDWQTQVYVTTKNYNPDVYCIWEFEVTAQDYDTNQSTVQYKIYAGMYPDATLTNGCQVGSISISVNDVTKYSGGNVSLTYMGQEILVASGTFKVTHSKNPYQYVINETENNRLPSTSEYFEEWFPLDLFARLTSNNSSTIVSFSHSLMLYNIWPWPTAIPEDSVYTENQEPCFYIMVPTLKHHADTSKTLSHIELCMMPQNGGDTLVERTIQASELVKGVTPWTLTPSYFDGGEYQALIDWYNANKTTNLYVRVFIRAYYSSISGDTAQEQDYRSFPYASPYEPQILIKLSDCAPYTTPTITDKNAATVALTGDNTKLVRYMSNAEVYVNPTAVEGATVTSFKFINNGFSYLDTEPVTISRVEDNKFEFYVTDSRKETVGKVVETAWVPYVPLTVECKPENPTGEGLMRIVVEGQCFNGSFGTANNTLSVYYRIKHVPSGGGFSAWRKISDVSFNSNNLNTYTAEVEVSGLNYLDTYVIEAYAVDALVTKYSNQVTIAAEPIFDWSYGDFNFNIPVNINGNLTITGTLEVTGDIILNGISLKTLL